MKRLALIIGISKYENASSLKNPVNDANSMAIVLKKLGFDVIILKDSNYKDFKVALNEFGDKLNDYEVGMFYFAGHGIQVKGLNYLIPSDANPKSENQVEYDCINANLILSLMEDASNSINLIVLDACRNNPFERSWERSLTNQGLSYMSAPYGTLIAYSTAPNKTASDGEGQNGLYTSELLDEIISPNMTIIKVLQNVRQSVIKITEGNQVPWESTSLLDDFVFNDNHYFSLSTFCKKLIYNNRDVVFNQLKLEIWDTNRIVHSGIPLNEMDAEEGVLEVYYKNGVNYFDLFKEIEVKIMRNGERIYHLFTISRDYERITLISKELYKTLGGGIYDDKRHSSFREVDKIKKLAKGRTKKADEELITVWYFKNVTFTLKYLIQPKMRLLMFTVNITPEKKVIEKNILEALNNDYVSLIESSAKIKTEQLDSGFLEDYFITLDKPEFDFFDSATIKVFSDDSNFHKSSNLILSRLDGNLDIKLLSLMISEITMIYGLDNSGEGYLTGDEIELIKENRHWAGRKWDLNIQHQLYDSESQGEEMMYGIYIDYLYPEYEIELTILGYKSLLKLI